MKKSLIYRSACRTILIVLLALVAWPSTDGAEARESDSSHPYAFYHNVAPPYIYEDEHFILDRGPMNDKICASRDDMQIAYFSLLIKQVNEDTVLDQILPKDFILNTLAPKIEADCPGHANLYIYVHFMGYYIAADLMNQSDVIFHPLTSADYQSVPESFHVMRRKYSHANPAFFSLIRKDDVLTLKRDSYKSRVMFDESIATAKMRQATGKKVLPEWERPSDEFLAAKKRIKDAESGQDVFALVSAPAGGYLRLMHQGDFEALKIAAVESFKKSMNDNPATGLLMSQLPGSSRMQERLAETSRFQPLLAQYIMAKTAEVGFCGAETSSITITTRKTEQWVNLWGIPVSPGTHSSSNQSFAVPSRFKPIVSETILGGLPTGYASELKAMVRKAGGCNSPLLQKLEDNMIHFSNM